MSATPSTGGTPYVGYDDVSSLSAISPYHATGTTIIWTTCLVHDALGRLTAVGPAKVLAGPDAKACRSESDLKAVWVRFRYDARNRRVGRQDGVAPLTGPWKQWVFTPDGSPLTELWKPTVSGGAWTVEREYVWLEGRPLAQVEYPGPAGGNEGYVYLVHVDHLGQPRALTSTSGALVWSASPSRPYGDLAEVTASDPANGRTIVTNLRLPGQYDERLLPSFGVDLQDLQGPYYNWNRWYLPGLGRYLELDPIALQGGFNGAWGPNWYGYSDANPLRFIDPEGLDACYLNYDGYPITIPGTSVTAGLGHAGVLTFDPQTGKTRYYEYGRYESDFGEVKRRVIPDLEIGPNGQPTPDSWSNLKEYLSRKHGKGRPVSSQCKSDSDFDKANAFAEQRMRDPNRRAYSLEPVQPESLQVVRLGSRECREA